MILITGAAGFIGSRLAHRLAAEGAGTLVLADDFSRADKAPNHEALRDAVRVDRTQLWDWLRGRAHALEAVYHLGARTDTAEPDEGIFDQLNLQFSKILWRICTEAGVPLIYASSAATYGDGSLGFSDDVSRLPQLRPLNAYARSKHAFDQWVLEQDRTPPFWAGFKFFNVYGPGEQHKGRMASVVWHAGRQILEGGTLRLFRSHRPDCPDGGQRRDFIFVDDVVKTMRWMLMQRSACGLYNLGSGQARTFLDLGHAVFAAMGRVPDIRFIDMPADIRDSYQYFTEADMTKLRNIAFPLPFVPLEEGVRRYMQEIGLAAG
ncbi:MAG: ADP-glyceromanno-heptose 6-epimerase [Bacteroidia bacterium]|nr:ADP-glyceromanno-heptose 6-epimerase [Bacteroidia bacterium]